MSVKAMAMVWDYPCPSQIGTFDFKPNHKYVLLAYADHADHNGRNIWPAVPTIAKKTGYVDRSVQRITDELETCGMLIPDGFGPKGTNKWRLPVGEGGDILSPVTFCQGDIDDKSLGDIPSGDIPSGDKMSPELKEPEQYIKDIQNTAFSIFARDFMSWRKLERILEAHRIEKIEGGYRVYCSNGSQGQFTDADVYNQMYSKTFENHNMKLEFTDEIK